jgi:hypothetical protein
VIVALLLALFSAASQASPTPSPEVIAGISAYERGDYKAAFRILKPIVYDARTRNQGIGDPWALF